MGALLVVLLSAGCGAAQQSTITTSADGNVSGRVTLPVSSAATTCAVQMSGHDATVIYRSTDYNVAPECNLFIRVEATGGNFWVNAAPSPPYGTTNVCNLADTNTGVTASVFDDGGAMFGQSACTGLISAGWQESGP